MVLNQVQGENEMLIKKIAAALIIATSVTGAVATTAQAGYYTVQCGMYGCINVYVPTCANVPNGWGGWTYICG